MNESVKTHKAWLLWGVELSPYLLKLQAALTYKGINFRRLPAYGSRFENTRVLLNLERAKKNKEVTRYPRFRPEFDEYPTVPFLSRDGRHFEYDSTAIIQHLDAQAFGRNMLPDDAAMRFIVNFIDEAFDEFGLYLVHHMRWVASAKSTPMGQYLASELKTLLPPGGAWLIANTFPKRQVRRLPYLFSVAPKGYKAGVKRSLTPAPYRDFPETHTLLNQSWEAYVDGMEAVLCQQPYLMGAQLTLADASAYGHLGMNLIDPETADKLSRRAPHTMAWLKTIRDNKHRPSHITQKSGEFKLNPSLSSLLNPMMGTFAALMVQNEQAYYHAKKQGRETFNEAAFKQNKAIFSGKLRGYPFKTVVKSFQIPVWQNLKAQWQQLTDADKTRVKSVMAMTALFDPIDPSDQ